MREVKYKYEIGQVVAIDRLGGNYSHWTEKFKELEFKVSDKPHFTRTRDLDKYFIIFNRSLHNEERPQNGNIYAIQCLDEPDIQYLMHEDALKVVQIPNVPIDLATQIILINYELNENFTRE